MTFEKLFVLEKLEQINGYLAEAKEFFRFSDEDILKDSEKMHIAERLLQLIVDAMIDINQHFIKELDLKSSEDFQGTFYILAENNVLPPEFAEKIAPVVAVRNRIVHRYEELDKELFIKTFRKNQDDFRKFVDLIKDRLNKT